MYLPCCLVEMPRISSCSARHAPGSKLHVFSVRRFTCALSHMCVRLRTLPSPRHATLMPGSRMRVSCVCRHTRHAGIMPHFIVRNVMWQLLNGLSYLHQNWVIHRDLKVCPVLSLQ